MCRRLLPSITLLASVAISCTEFAVAEPLTGWKNPIVKRGYLDSPLVEVTPLSFKGKLYLLECWRARWDWPGRPEEGENMWMTKLPQGPEHYDKRKYLGRVMKDHILGTAIVWGDRVYAFGTNEVKKRREVSMTWSDDMKHWSKPVKVFDSPKGSIFNVAVTRDERGMVFLWETNGYGRPFTMCYGRVEKPTDPWNPGVVEGARYGIDKYTGGPALYYEGGWYYTLYLESLPGRQYETRITRSKDLKNWQDAPADRPLITFDPKRTCLMHQAKNIKECNASDVELCCHKGKTILYFTGGNQHVGGDLQWATYDGTPRELLERFYRP